MHKLTVLLFAFFLSEILIGQKIETIYLNPGDSTSNLYIVVYPPKQPYKGYAFMVPGMFQKPDDVLVQSELPAYAAQQGILVFIPTFKTGIRSLGFDTATQASFLEMLDHVNKTYPLKGLPFFAGGFSIGGTCVVKYAELAISNNYPVKPKAVFAIDAPLDLERMYTSMIREIKLPNSPDWALEESNYVLNRFDQEFGGSPKEYLTNYHQISPYSFNDTTRQAIKSLIHLPIRLYTEPDILWWINEGVDYSLMNSIDFAAMINELNRLGNDKAELMISTGKGYRKPDNTRHPHSWSIVDHIDAVRWMLDQ